MQNFVYLIGCEKTREAAVVDPAWNVPKIMEAAAAENLKIRKIFVTHGHFDHTNGIQDLVSATDAEVYVQDAETRWASLPPQNRRLVKGEERVSVGSVDVTLMHTPGHTVGSQCLLLQDQLISGDTLFVGTCGRCDFDESSPADLYRSLTRLKELDAETVFWPGHDYSDRPKDTIGRQRTTNPFLLCRSLPEFLRMVGVKSGADDGE